MDLAAERVGDVDVLTVPLKTLESSNAQGFKTAALAAAAKSTKLIIDLQQVQFVDSMGCGVLLSILRDLAGRGGEMKLCDASRSVRAVLELIRMHRIVDILNNRDEALRAFAG